MLIYLLVLQRLSPRHIIVHPLFTKLVSHFLQMIHKVNLKFNEYLDEGNYSIPRLATGFKGDTPPVFKVPQLKEKPLKHSRSLDSTANKVTPPDSPVKNVGIAGIWAATGRYEQNEEKVKPFNDQEDILAPLPEGFDHANGPHNGTGNGSKPASRRGSESNMNDTDSVHSDITANTVQQPSSAVKVPSRRSSLAQMVGLASSTSKFSFSSFFLSGVCVVFYRHVRATAFYYLRVQNSYLDL